MYATSQTDFIARLNDTFDLHAYWNRDAGIETKCLALIVDERYVLDFGIQLRLAVSFGDNPFSETMPPVFVRPPILPGEFIFGVHLVGTRDSSMSIFDKWCDGFEAGDCTQSDDAIRRATDYLQSLSDADYCRNCASDPSNIPEPSKSLGLNLDNYSLVANESHL